MRARHVSYIESITRPWIRSLLKLSGSFARLYPLLLRCSAAGIAGPLIGEAIAGRVLLSQVGEQYRLSSYEVLWYVS
jgi:hypothetical protein